MKTFAQRLEAARIAGNLRVSDLQTWFERPYHTISAWLHHDREPWEHADEIHRRLNLLEQAIKTKRGLPLPYALKRHERRAHVEGALRAVNGRLPGARAAR